VARVCLLWVNKAEVIGKKVDDELLNTYHSWYRTETGIELDEEIIADGFVSDHIVSDMETLRQLGVYGNVIFVDTTSDTPFFKAVLQPHGVAWYKTNEIQPGTRTNIKEEP